LVKEKLGHRSINSTLIYTQLISLKLRTMAVQWQKQ